MEQKNGPAAAGAVTGPLDIQCLAGGDAGWPSIHPSVRRARKRQCAANETTAADGDEISGDERIIEISNGPN